MVRPSREDRSCVVAGDEVDDRAVPFVWAIDENGTLLRLAISRTLVFACRDRLNYWHTLQELAGIHNRYVEEAIDRIIEEQRIAIEAEREQVQKEHEQELESVRAEHEAVSAQLDEVRGEFAHAHDSDLQQITLLQSRLRDIEFDRNAARGQCVHDREWRRDLGRASQRLRQDLATEHPVGADVPAHAAEQVHFQWFELHQLQQLYECFALAAHDVSVWYIPDPDRKL